MQFILLKEILLSNKFDFLFQRQYLVYRGCLKIILIIWSHRFEVSARCNEGFVPLANSRHYFETIPVTKK